MKQYYIELRNGQGLCKHYYSYSRNARKHLLDNVSNSDIGAKCIVWSDDIDGQVVSACEYDEKGAIRYINW